MKKLYLRIAMAVAAILLLSGCGLNMNLVNNHNLNQTNVVLSQKNYHVVKTVEAEVTATYVVGIGGLSKKALHDNVVAELTKNAALTGSQALVNVTVNNSSKMILCYNEITCHAVGTVIEFDE